MLDQKKSLQQNQSFYLTIPKSRERFVDVGSFLQAVAFCTWGSLPESKKPISNWDLVAKLSQISAAIVET
jgi:hypothetical protein